MKIKAIITGVTGMVGEGVLHECINHPLVESILIVGRSSSGITHEKIKEVVVQDFFNIAEYRKLFSEYNACFFCLGTTSVGKSEAEYEKITYQLTRTFADTCYEANPDMTFCYVSGTGTDSSEEGRVAWARIKGRTENYISALGFRGAYMFRPGLILPTKGFKNTLMIYKMFLPLLPVFKMLFPKSVCSLNEVGTAMINCALYGCEKGILEVKDIKSAAKVNKKSATQ